MPLHLLAFQNAPSCSQDCRLGLLLGTEVCGGGSTWEDTCWEWCASSERPMAAAKMGSAPIVGSKPAMPGGPAAGGPSSLSDLGPTLVPPVI